jgi:hypothetical protein
MPQITAFLPMAPGSACNTQNPLAKTHEEGTDNVWSRTFGSPAIPNNILTKIAPDSQAPVIHANASEALAERRARPPTKEENWDLLQVYPMQSKGCLLGCFIQNMLR